MTGKCVQARREIWHVQSVECAALPRRTRRVARGGGPGRRPTQMSTDSGLGSSDLTSSFNDGEQVNIRNIGINKDKDEGVLVSAMIAFVFVTFGISLTRCAHFAHYLPQYEHRITVSCCFSICFWFLREGRRADADFYRNHYRLARTGEAVAQPQIGPAVAQSLPLLASPAPPHF